MPAAVSVAVAPAVHNAPPAGLAVTVSVGTSFTVTLTVLVFVQPALVPLTV